MIAYRKDIDGLRAVAVTMVVVCHTGQGWLPGGFVGVDVFFVISGFLISTLVLGEAAEGRFSLVRFYDRRIRRIVPAYAVVALAAAAAALILSPPSELASFGKRLAASAAFMANFQFRAEANYFAPASADNPLLHLWSLSVEEQFYLIAPLALAVGLRLGGRRGLKAALAVAAAASFAGAVMLLGRNPAGAFYFTPVRAWELLVGALLAAGAGPDLSARPPLREALAVAGLCAVLAPAVFYTATSPAFPGWSALPPCLGAALLIHTGGQGPTRVGRWLSTRVMVALGLISYSLYLWHWPLFCFARLWLLRPLAPLEAVGLIGASLGLAALSWRWVERGPRRARNGANGLPPSFVWGGLALVGLFASGTLLARSGGLPGRADAAALAADRAQTRDPAAAGCLVGLRGEGRPTPCVLGDTAHDPRGSVMLIGDSHADALGPGLVDAARSLGLAVRERTLTSCRPAETSVDNLGAAAAAGCRRFKKAVLQEALSDGSLRAVVLVARWNQPVGSGRAGGDLYAPLSPWMARLRAAGRPVVLVAQPPEFAPGGGRCIVRARFVHRDEQACFTPRAEQDRYAERSLGALRRLAAADAGVTLVDATSLYCDARWCRPVSAGRVTFHDVHHLNPAGARMMTPLLTDALRRAIRPSIGQRGERPRAPRRLTPGLVGPT